MTARARLQTALRLIYPPRCLGCGGLVESDFGLCGACWRDTAFIGGLVCDLCGTPLPGDDTGDAAHCDDCLAIARPWVQGRAALLYRDTARRMVLALKHGDRHDVAGPAALWMSRIVRPILRPGTLIVPVPLHFWRLVGRRYNQSALLAQRLAEVLECDWCPDALLRQVKTPSLDGQTRDQRFATLSGAITANPARAELVRDRPLLIVDDVMTSGATLAAATEAALASRAGEVCVATLARVAKAP